MKRGTAPVPIMVLAGCGAKGERIFICVLMGGYLLVLLHDTYDSGYVRTTGPSALGVLFHDVAMTSGPPLITVRSRWSRSGCGRHTGHIGAAGVNPFAMCFASIPSCHPWIHFLPPSGLQNLVILSINDRSKHIHNPRTD
jgi:hypothetical protein